MGLLNVGVPLVSIIFRTLDNLYSTSVDKRILYLADYEDDTKDKDVCCFLKTDDWTCNIVEENCQSIDNRLHPAHPKNVWVNSKGNIRIYQNSINEFVGIGKSLSCKQYPSNYFDILLLDVHKKETMESEFYQELLFRYSWDTHLC